MIGDNSSFTRCQVGQRSFKGRRVMALSYIPRQHECIVDCSSEEPYHSGGMLEDEDLGEMYD